MPVTHDIWREKHLRAAGEQTPRRLLALVRRAGWPQAIAPRLCRDPDPEDGSAGAEVYRNLIGGMIKEFKLRQLVN